MTKKTIGILAGMGPCSTAPFLESVYDECRKQYGAKYDDEFPQIMVYSLPAPFYIDKPVDQSRLREVVCKGAQRLASTGVDFIVIPCNTVHSFFDEIINSVKVPVLNMVQETIRQLPSKVSRIALLATELTITSGVYQKEIFQHGMDVLDMSFVQPQVNELIVSVKNRVDEDILRTQWSDLVQQCIDHGADAIVIACTDLSIFTNQLQDIFIVDSSRLLAVAIVQRYLAE